MKQNIFYALLLGTFLFATPLQAAVVSGEAAPEFTLTDTHGNEHSLSDFKGKNVVLEWINPDCPFVKKYYKNGDMQGLQSSYGGQDVVWLSIASSAPGKQGHYEPAVWNELTKQKGASPTAVLLDPSGKVGKLYGAKTTPHMYVIDAKGVLVYQGAIDSTPSANPADIAKSEIYVQSVLDAIIEGKEAPVSSVKSYGCSVKYGS